MRNKILKIGLMLGLLGGVLAPVPVLADGISLSVNLGADDEAHFHFADRRIHHRPEILRAARQLQGAKHSLWEVPNDFNGHRNAAIRAINAALDELRLAEEVRPHRPR